MKLLNTKIITSLATLVLASSGLGSTTISGGNVGILQDNLGNDISASSLFAVVVSTTDSDFADIEPGQLLEAGMFINGSDDILLTVGEVTEAGDGTGNFFAQAGSAGLVDFVNGISAGDPFILYWFPDSSLASNETEAAQFYGSARFEDGNTAVNSITEWFLQDNGGSVSAATVGLDSSADLTANIQIVPEPASLTLLGLGAFSFITRRRRA